ncbi:SDR family NAD(P)-dependent oxidoreductase [Streptomyces nodosus]|uniref:SDR family NAD(P)-dependent oxidoreductase n=1 Tax=Streptomyces nodosus TaxID=40318 RepID=UPI003807DEB9
MGRAGALEFARRGATGAVLDLDENSARQTAELIVKEGGRAESVAVDIGDEQSVQRAVAQVVALFGGLDFAVDNAGSPSHTRLLTEMPGQEWERVLPTPTWREGSRGMILWGGGVADEDHGWLWWPSRSSSSRRGCWLYLDFCQVRGSTASRAPSRSVPSSHGTRLVDALPGRHDRTGPPGLRQPAKAGWARPFPVSGRTSNEPDSGCGSVSPVRAVVM